MIIGCPIGTIFAQLIGGYLCSLSFLGGWPLIFYVVGKIYDYLSKMKLIVIATDSLTENANM